MKSTPLQIGSWKLYPLGTVNSVAMGSTVNFEYADSGSRGTEVGSVISLNGVCVHGVLDSDQ